MTEMEPAHATEQLFREADRQDAHPNEPGVYALEINLPEQRRDILQLWDAKFDERPDYLPRLIDCHGCIYVGAAASVQRRINEHLDGETRKAVLPSVFSISRIHGAWWYDDRDAAFEAEYNRARELDRQTLPSTYVHSR